mgnify:CR=1 FL=1
MLYEVTNQHVKHYSRKTRAKKNVENCRNMDREKQANIPFSFPPHPLHGNCTLDGIGANLGPIKF